VVLKTVFIGFVAAGEFVSSLVTQFHW